MPGQNQQLTRLYCEQLLTILATFFLLQLWRSLIERDIGGEASFVF
jgi:hypothetical protein